MCYRRGYARANGTDQDHSQSKMAAESGRQHARGTTWQRRRRCRTIGILVVTASAETQASIVGVCSAGRGKATERDGKRFGMGTRFAQDKERDSEVGSRCLYGGKLTCLCYSQLEAMLGVKEMYTWLDVCGGCPFLFRGEFSCADVCPKCHEVRGQCWLAVGWLLSGYCLAVVWLRIIRFRLSGRLGGAWRLHNCLLSLWLLPSCCLVGLISGGVQRRHCPETGAPIKQVPILDMQKFLSAWYGKHAPRSPTTCVG